jgi:ubiquinone/menaquinone biosynthesis C-methylase UbiE
MNKNILKNFREVEKNIFKSTKVKYKPSRTWLFYNFLFILWIWWVKISRRNFSDSAKQADIIFKKIDLSGNTIDIAGGSGWMSKYWRPTKSSDYYTIADPLFRKDLKSRQAYKKGRLLFYECFAERLPFKNEQFDTAIIAASIDHVNDPLKAIEESSRVLKRNGHLLIVQKICEDKITYIIGHAKTYDLEQIKILINNYFTIKNIFLSQDKKVVYIWAANRNVA